MVNPVPGFKVTTGFKLKGRHWTACGWHTGQDYAAPAGTNVVAARGGKVSWTDYGSAFGRFQFSIRPGDGTEDFYAHTTTRPKQGAIVATGQYIAEVGSEGNSTAPHLHFERHSSIGWACNKMADPMLSHNAKASSIPGGGASVYPRPTSGKVYLSKLKYGTSNSDSVWYLQDALNAHSLRGGARIPLTAGYFGMTDAEVIKCQTQHGFGADAPGTSFVGAKQASHLFAGRGIIIVDDA